MTEAEWRAGTDPTPMLEFLRGRATDRKWHLYSVACCRHVWHLIADPDCRTAVDVLEMYADGRAPAEAFDAAANGVRRLFGVSPAFHRVNSHRERAAVMAAMYAVDGEAMMAAEEVAVLGARDDDPIALSGLLRDIFGNPFRHITADPRWLTSTVVGLADAIYAERAFDRLPILADALKEAGCDSVGTRNHRCHTMEELLDLTFDWFAVRPRFRIQSGIYGEMPGK